MPSPPACPSSRKRASDTAWRRCSTSTPYGAAARRAGIALERDPPVQHVALSLPSGRCFHVFNVHCARRSPWQYPGRVWALRWRSVAGWAEGSLLRPSSALAKRSSFVLPEGVVRCRARGVHRICGDFNAEDHDTALRLACAGEDDTGSGHSRRGCSCRSSSPCRRTGRFTVLDHGRREMLATSSRAGPCSASSRQSRSITRPLRRARCLWPHRPAARIAACADRRQLESDAKASRHSLKVAILLARAGGRASPAPWPRSDECARGSRRRRCRPAQGRVGHADAEAKAQDALLAPCQLRQRLGDALAER